MAAMTATPDQILSVAQMRAAEQALVAGGTSVDDLMQRAGRGAAVRRDGDGVPARELLRRAGCAQAPHAHSAAA